MAVTDNIPRGDVVASLNFYQSPADGSKPFNYVDDPPAGEPQRNFSQKSFDVTIHDARGSEADFTLDRDGFQILSRPSPEDDAVDFADDDAIKKTYYPSVEKLLLEQIPGSNKIYIFDHTVRRAQPNSHRSPVLAVHIDQTASSAAQRVRRYYSPDEADALLKGRFRIVNVWKPISAGPVESSPLAFASSASVSTDPKDDEVIPVEHRYPDGYTGQTAGVRYSEKQKWHYLSGVRPDERILLECFDSEALKPGSGVQGGRTPHTAFEHPGTKPDAKPRESIEVRALVFGP